MPKNTKKPVEPEPVEDEEQEEVSEGEEGEEFDDFQGQFGGEPSEEEEKLMVEIKKAEDEKNDEVLVDLLTQLASVLSMEQEVPRAIDALQREIELRIKLNHEDITKLKNARANLSILLQVVGDYTASLELIEQAIESARKRKSVFDEAESLSDKATMYLAKYEMEKSEKEEESDEEEKSEEIPEDILRSIQAGEECLKLCYDKNTDSKLLESDVARRANHAMGEAYMHIQDVEKAVPHWDQVVELSSKIEESKEAIAALNSAGKAYFASAEALELAEQEEGADNGEAKTKMIEKALGVFQKAKSRVVDDEDHEDLVETLSGFVSCYDMLKQSEKAVEAQKEILAVVLKAGDEEGTIEAHMTLSDMYRESGKFVDAVKELNNAKKIAEPLELDDILEAIDDAIAQLQNESKDSLQGKKQKK